MKPSERIREIARDRGQAHPGLLDALAYLDERHEAENDPRHQLAELREALGAEDHTHEQALEVARQGVAALTLEGFESRDSESLQLLRECIDENLAYPSEESEEAGDYCAAIRYAADRLHGLRPASGGGLRAAVERRLSELHEIAQDRMLDATEGCHRELLSQLLSAHPAPTANTHNGVGAASWELAAKEAGNTATDLRARIDRAVETLDTAFCMHGSMDHYDGSYVGEEVGKALRILRGITRPSPADGASEEGPGVEWRNPEHARITSCNEWHADLIKQGGYLEIILRGSPVFTREQCASISKLATNFATTGSLKGAGK